MAGFLYAQPTYPVDMDIPYGPVGISSPGGSNLPFISGNVDSNTPIIAECTKTVRPGESIAMAGWRMNDGFRLKVWAEGMLFEVTPDYADYERAMALIPANITTSIYGKTGTVPRSTMLIWPSDPDGEHRPIRVNGPELWWVHPKRKVTGTGRKITLFGNNLRINTSSKVVCQRNSDTPVVLANGGWKNGNVYECNLPANFTEGTYKIWIHNGTGGEYGWSDYYEIEVEAPLNRKSTIFNVDSYTGNDNTKIVKAIAAAEANGGGVVTFSARTYEVEGNLSFGSATGVPITFNGAGMGTYDPINDTFSGTYTLITDKAESAWNDHSLINLKCRGGVIKNMSIYNRSDHIYQFAVLAMTERDQILKNCNVVQGSNTRHQGGCVRPMYNGVSQTEIRDCSIYAVGGPITIGQNDTRFPEARTRQVLVQDCIIRGIASSGSTLGTNGIYGLGGGEWYIRENDFQSADRKNGKILNRTMNLYWSGIYNVFAWKNDSTHIGPHASVSGVHGNSGEQYIAHLAGPTTEVYTATAGSSMSITLDVDYDVIYDIVTSHQGDDWFVYLCQNKGAGQYRKIEQLINNGGKAKVTVVKDFRNPPTNGTKATIQMLFHHINICDNYVDTDPNGDENAFGMKTTGFQLHANSFNCIARDNTFRNMTWGARLVSSVANEGACTGWNIVEGNLFERITNKMSSAQDPVAFSDEMYATISGDIEAYWYSVGNVFRNNDIDNCAQATSIGFGWQDGHPSWYSQYTKDVDRGIMMTIVENNAWANLLENHLVLAPTNWALIRANEGINTQIFQSDKIYEVHIE